MPRDEAFYYLHEQEEIQGEVLSLVDKFMIKGNANFLEKVKKGISDTLTLSRVDRDKFKFTLWDIEKYQDPVKVSMKDIVNSFKEITEIRKADW